MKIFSILTIVILALLSSFTYAQPGDMPPNAKAGKCYAKCLIGDTYTTKPLKVFIYLGTDSTIKKDYTVDTTLIIIPQEQKWVKRRSDSACKSEDPSDCLVWCLTKTEAKTMRIQRYLLDTTVTSDFIGQSRDIKYIARRGGFTEWREIVCGNKVNAKFIQRLRNALGMEEDKSVCTMTSQIKAALVKYQREHGLPVGQLDKGTIKHLNIKWPK